MPAVQTTYNERIPEAVAGLRGSMRDWDAITRLCEPAGGIGFGLAVKRGTDTEKQCDLGGALTDFLGVSTRDVTVDNHTTADEFAQDQNVGILTRGEIWVQVSGTPGPDDPVHYNATTGVFAASGGTGPIVGARWMTATRNGLCKLHLGGNNQAAA